MTGFPRDLRIDWRAVATLSLGISISVAVSAVAYELAYSLPAYVQDPRTLFSAKASGPGRETDHGLVSFPEYEELLVRGTSLVQPAASFVTEGSARAGGASATRVMLAYTSNNYFLLTLTEN